MRIVNEISDFIFIEDALQKAAAILKEAEDLEYTLLFNVNSDLAIRTFAINAATNSSPACP